MRILIRRRLLLVIFLLPLLVINCDSPEISIYQEYAAKLETIRNHKLAELHEYMGFVKNEAEKISSDNVMKQLFLQKHDYYLTPDTI